MAASANLYSSHQAMFRDSPVAYLISVALIPVFGIGLVPLGLWFLISRHTRLEIDAERIIFTRGLLSKDRIVVARAGIRSVRVSQSLFQRLMDVGTVRVTTAGDQPEITARGMPDARRIRSLLGG